jgi:glycosyltransferase involved in cell wall biosynthesis
MNIAVLIPCYNEEKTIATVIEDFHKYLPNAKIYVYDNNCTDRTMDIVSKYDYCIPGICRKQGKGATVRKMFKEIDADVYLMVDGDTTYPAKYAPRLVRAIAEDRCDMILGTDCLPIITKIMTEAFMEWVTGSLSFWSIICITGIYPI